MAMEFGYFDSEITGTDTEGMPIFDRATSADLLASFYAKLISNGVLADPGTCFQVIAKENMVVTVQPGFAMINGRFGYDTQSADLNIDPAPARYSRIDRVVIRCNYLDRKVELAVKTGTAAVTPTAPELLQPTSGDYYELGLATIQLSANQTVITQSSITDTRYDSTACGVVTQLIDHLDTSAFFAQLTAFYDEFVAQCDEDYTNYTNQIDLFISNLRTSGMNQLQEVVDSLKQFESDSESDFETWFEGIKGQLDSDAAGHLQNEINLMTEDIFKKYYGVCEKVTEIINGSDGTKTITAVGDGVRAVTTFDKQDGVKTITTVIDAEDSNYTYTETVVIETSETGKRITESYTQASKGV